MELGNILMSLISEYFLFASRKCDKLVVGLCSKFTTKFYLYVTIPLI